MMAQWHKKLGILKIESEIESVQLSQYLHSQKMKLMAGNQVQELQNELHIFKRRSCTEQEVK